MITDPELRRLVAQHLGDSPESRAFAGGLLRLRDRHVRVRAWEADAPDRKVQRDRMDDLADTFRRLQRFTPIDWQNLREGAYRAARDEFRRLPETLPDLAGLIAAAEHAAAMLTPNGRPPDSDLWRFLEGAIADHELFFGKPPSYSARAKFVKLLEAVAPIIEPAWSGKSIADAVRRIVVGGRTPEI